MNTTHALLNNKKRTKLAHAIGIAGMGLILTACGGGSETPENVVQDNTNQNEVSPSENATILSGSAIKGAIENGIVTAYLVENVAGSLRPSSTQIGSSVRTDEDGGYSLTLNGDFEDQAVVVEITADAMTTMKCDTTDGCGQNGNGSDIEFGDRFAVSSDFSLKSIVSDVDAGAELSVSINPLTHMVVSKLEGLQSGYTRGNIAAAFSEVEALFDLDAGSLRLAPADITKLESYANLSVAELEMGVISASFLSLVNEPAFNTIEDVIEDIETRFENAGSLTAQSASDSDEVSLDKVFLAASTIASDLVTVLPDSEHLESLNVVAQSTSSSYDELAPEQEAVAVISSQPQNVSVTEGEQAQFSVSASGDSLTYQWRKDGVSIVGQTSSTFSISVAELADQGEYDVVITNGGGSVTSLSALLTVAEADNDSGAGQQPTINLVNIVSSPETQSVDEGGDVVLSVAVSGNGTIAYQWRKGGVSIDGAVSNSLSLSGVSLSDAGSYDVVVTNEAGSVTSDAASLTVNSVNADVLITWSIPQTRVDGSELELYDINGYRVRYGTSENAMTNTLNVNGASETSLRVNDLTPGTYYFSIATIDSDGGISEYTDVSIVSI